jgi:hypothetical protein
MCAASRAAFGDPLEIETRGELPFSTAELEAALALRTDLATPGSTSRIQTRVVADGPEIQIDLAGRTRRIGLDGARGAEAARLVAFAIIDVAGEYLDPPRGRSPVRVAASQAPIAELAVSAAAPRGRDELRWSIAVWAAAGTHRAATVELEVGLRDRLHAIAAAGATLPATSGTGDMQVTTSALPFRVGLGWRIAGVELRAMAALQIDRARAQRSSTDVQLGGGASLTYVAPLSLGGVHPCIGAGLDVFSSSIAYRVQGAPVASAERLAYWAGLGLAFEVAR